MNILPNSIISFYLEVWDNNGVKSLKLFTSMVKRIIHDPLKKHETKLLVVINNDSYGIPVSEVLDFAPPSGTQLSLFL